MTKPEEARNSPVRRRCLEFIEALHDLGYTSMIPLEDAKDLFMATLGICDKASIRAYFGVIPHRSIQHIERIARYQSGVTSMKRIDLTQKIGYMAGYFELLRLATIQRKGLVWFMCLNEVGVVPQIVPESFMNGCVGKSISKISLSSTGIVEQCEQPKQPFTIRVNDRVETTREERESIGVERETKLDFRKTSDKEGVTE